MERRVAGIIRWLERCIKAYKDGAVESALMDAECARADMETLRSELWEKNKGRRCACTRRFSFFKAAEALFCALGIMLITATPLALHQGAPAREARAEGNFTLEWVTSDERELLGNLRKRPDDSVAMAVKPEEPIAELVTVPVPVSVPLAEAAPERPTEPVKRRNPEPAPLKNEQKKPETNLTYDRILSLIEAGERAMKDEAPAIKVENAR